MSDREISEIVTKSGNSKVLNAAELTGLDGGNGVENELIKTAGVEQEDLVITDPKRRRIYILILDKNIDVDMVCGLDELSKNRYGAGFGLQARQGL